MLCVVMGAAGLGYALLGPDSRPTPARRPGSPVDSLWVGRAGCGVHPVWTGGGDPSLEGDAQGLHGVCTRRTLRETARNGTLG